MIPCFCHIINLAVQDFVKALREDSALGLGHVLESIREIARILRTSQLKWETFEECCRFYKIFAATIPLDIKTRWNSTFRMLETAIYLRTPIERFLAIDRSMSQYVLTDAQWELAEVLMVILIPFKRVTVRF